MRFSPILTLTLLMGSWTTANAGIYYTVEGAGVMNSTVAGIIGIETFDGLPAGPNGGFASAIGTYSAGGSIDPFNEYGGANDSNFLVVGGSSQGKTFSAELTLPGGVYREFFGLWWSAMDPSNSLEIYRDGTLLRTFTRADFDTVSAPDVGPAGGFPICVDTGSGFPPYCGNPVPNTNAGEVRSENFVYVNIFSSDATTDFNRIVFRNDTSAQFDDFGFESDNHSIRAARNTVPEPSTYAMLASAFGALALLRRFRR